jgi:ankyrin repeat protein
MYGMLTQEYHNRSKAVYKGDVSMVALLCAKGANTNTTTLAGEPALYRAVYKGNTSLVSILLAHGANPNGKTASDEAPLYRAV